MRVTLSPPGSFKSRDRRDSRAVNPHFEKNCNLHAACDTLCDSKSIDDIWREFKATGSLVLRNRLVIHYMSGHVRNIARRLRSQLPPQVEVDDLVDEAYEGLVDVIERFDLEKDVRFETFSSKRLHGAMRDYLRRIDPIPRLARTRSKQAASLIETFHKKHGRGPDERELQRLYENAATTRFQKKYGRDPDEAEADFLMKSADSSLRRTMREGRPALTVSFTGSESGGTSLENGDSESDPMAGFQDRDQRSPLDRAAVDDLRKWITRDFPRRDRLIIILYFYEQLTMREIGLTLGCSESRVSQRLDSILQCLKARIQRHGTEREFLRK